VRGFEFDASVSPTKGLNFTTAVTYLDAEYDSFPGASTLVPGSFAVVPANLTGRTPAGIPKWTVTVGGNYTTPISDSMSLVLATDYIMTGTETIAEGLPTFRRTTENLSGSIGLAFENGFQLSVWGRNLTNDAYITTLFPGVAQPGTLSGYRNQPRTYGVTARYKF
jgi:iron complex outermembrane recepter protein